MKLSIIFLSVLLIIFANTVTSTRPAKQENREDEDSDHYNGRPQILADYDQPSEDEQHESDYNEVETGPKLTIEDFIEHESGAEVAQNCHEHDTAEGDHASITNFDDNIGLKMNAQKNANTNKYEKKVQEFLYHQGLPVGSGLPNDDPVIPRQRRKASPTKGKGRVAKDHKIYKNGKRKVGT